MDCEQVREQLDAHALGALSHREAADVEQHVAGCLSCWEELQAARETAALLTLTVPIQEPPARLREKIITQAQRETQRTPVPIGSPDKQGFFGRIGWGLATGFAGFAAVGAFAFAAFLQVQVDDLEGENSDLETQVQTSEEEIGVQNAALTVLAAADTRKVEMDSDFVRGVQPAVATYSWSPSHESGFILCENMPELAEGEQFTVWLTFESGDPIPIASFTPTAEKCHAALDLGGRGRPKGIGITKEQEGSSGSDPNFPWVLFTEFAN